MSEVPLHSLLAPEAGPCPPALRIGGSQSPWGVGPVVRVEKRPACHPFLVLPVANREEWAPLVPPRAAVLMYRGTSLI
jgi:hypothetical protein